jgi:hypothetical protein
VVAAEAYDGQRIVGGRGLSATLLLLCWAALLGFVAWRLAGGEPQPSAVGGAVIAFPAPPQTPAPAQAPQAPIVEPAPARSAAAPVAPAAPRATASWQRFQVQFDANDRRPRIAVVIGELGLQRAFAERALALPGPVTLMFDAYADDLPDWIARARQAGHEVLIGVPMEPADPRIDAGPLALLTGEAAAQNPARLERMLQRADGAVGITNIQGERFAAFEDAVRPILHALGERGLLVVDARTTPRSVIPRLASELGVPRAINDRTIDEDLERSAIDARLAEIERIARETGTAVAMGSRTPLTLERLAAWLPTLAEKGFALAPITAVINRQRDR